jgi:hypothetical protein
MQSIFFFCEEVWGGKVQVAAGRIVTSYEADWLRLLADMINV